MFVRAIGLLFVMLVTSIVVGGLLLFATLKLFSLI